MSKHTPETWRYEKSTKTIRSVPGNYWIATMDSWDGMCNNDANGRLIAAAPELLNALRTLMADLSDVGDDRDGETGEEYSACIQAREAIAKATEQNTSISIGDQVQSIETNWQGRVTGFDKMDGDECTYLVCHHVSGGQIEEDDKQWFSPGDVRLLRRAGMTQERASEIITECQKLATIGPWSDQLRKVMNSDEIAQVMAHWKTMSGSASFSDAILFIRNGK